MEKQFLCIDLKSFYASVECVKRGLNPLTTNLVVADESRTEKTICLAVSPALKQFGIRGRPRLFEVQQSIRKINKNRIKKGFQNKSSFNLEELNKDNNLAVNFIIAKPRMAQYIKMSVRIYEIYLKYISKEDIHVYSIDEVFIDITSYLKLNKMSSYAFAKMIINDIFKNTGITATAGIGTNLYLAKVAMDIVAKHIDPDENGVRIAYLDEISYREKLWNHKPLTDFWRVGRGYANKLMKENIFTMGDIALCSLGKNTDYYNEDLLFKIFGVNAELLIDHAWGFEPCDIANIKKYKPKNSSIGTGQVLHCGYTFDKAKIVLKEMIIEMIYSLISKGLVTDIASLFIEYDAIINEKYNGSLEKDYYGRKVPKPLHSSINFNKYTSSERIIKRELIGLYEKSVNRHLLIRKIYVSFHVIDESLYKSKEKYEQMSLFGDSKINDVQDEIAETKEKQLQKTIIAIKKRFGKNSIMKALDIQEGATGIERNEQIGGHKA